MGKSKPKLKRSPPAADASKVYMHTRRGTIHLGNKDHPEKLGCGKPLTAVYSMIGDSAEGLYPLCNDCLPEDVRLEEKD